MLTADLVDVRKKDGEIILRPLDAAGREDALAIATTLLESAQAFVGKRREEVEEAWSAAADEAPPKRFKMAAGLRKLVADACTFEAEAAVDVVELRRVLFTHASQVRQTLPESEPFDRAAVLAQAAEQLGLEPDVVERGMFSDLRDEHLLRAAPTLDAPHLVDAWELGQAQAVLLTAVKVTCEVESSSAGLVRAFFAKLKFQKLLFSAERTERGWRVVIDGPYSMFDAVTKYGLRLALVLPALRALERWSLVADVRWGKTREALVFRLASEPATASSGEPAPKSKRRGAKDVAPKKAAAEAEAHLSDEVRELLDAMNALETGWHARPANVVLDVPGQGVCIPDLVVTRASVEGPVYVEVLGYWSRDAVFRRVELAERGLGARVVFAVSSRLRVSAEVLDDALPSSLYVYKGKMSPRAVLDHVAKLGSPLFKT